MEEAWTAVVGEALERGIKESGGRAVSGAKLRQLVAHVAAPYGVSYPPAGFESVSFSEFLKHFDSKVIVLRRRAQDILVAPVSRPELLVIPNNSGSQTQIRDDVFSAFVRIPREGDEKVPWYELAKDRFAWLPRIEGEASPGFVAVTPATMDEEMADRAAFINSLDLAPEIRETLSKALQGSGSSRLWHFSQLLREAQLSKKWHEYRFNLIATRIRRWSETHNIPWQDNWLVAPTSSIDDSNKAADAEISSEREGLKELLAQLDEDDLRRINVPLDIVLKLFRR